MRPSPSPRAGLLAAVLLLTAAPALAAETAGELPLPHLTHSLEEAQALAAREGKLIFIDFYSPN